MSSSSWYRVAAGLQLVARTVAQQASQNAAVTATQAVHHGMGVAASARTAAATLCQQQQQWSGSPATDSSERTRNGFAPNVASVSEETDFDISSTATSDQMHDNTDASILTKNLDLNGGPLRPVVEPSSRTSATANHEGETRESAELPATENQIAAENQIRSTSTTASYLDNTDTSMAEEGEEIERLKEGRPVPATRVGRAMGFASLGVGLAMGTAVEGVSRLFGRSDGGGSGVVVNDANADRLAASLCRMRGAALKMGQMLSIQDENLLPPALSRALNQVRQGADAMPNYQLVRQLERQLGTDWRDKFVSFDEMPFAAASIGQVHRATIRDDDQSIRPVVVKVQYPGVASSIESDLNNLAMLVTWSGLAPKGLFIENVIRVGREELQVECDYQREMKNQKTIKELVESDPVLQENRFVVPDAIEHLTTEQVLTSEYRPGGTIDKVAHLDQEERNRIGRTIMYLTMKELFVWRFMQTDPNWGNFLFDVNTRTTSLIDFGAAREYSKEFVDGYLRIVWASANRDEQPLMDQSYRMNFLTGQENDQMLRSHKLSGFTVGEPFWKSEPFDFRGSNISARMGEHTSVFLRHRLTPPPEEVYTLHRKLAGAYMLCIKLGAVIECRSMLRDIVAQHDFEDGMDPPRL